MANKKRYAFYTSNPKIQVILDELKKNRQISEVMNEVLSNGLGKAINKKLKELEKLGNLYKK